MSALPEIDENQAASAKVRFERNPVRIFSGASVWSPDEWESDGRRFFASQGSAANLAGDSAGSAGSEGAEIAVR
jgi:hypothetical protein